MGDRLRDKKLISSGINVKVNKELNIINLKKKKESTPQILI